MGRLFGKISGTITRFDRAFFGFTTPFDLQITQGNTINKTAGLSAVSVTTGVGSVSGSSGLGSVLASTGLGSVSTTIGINILTASTGLSD